MTFMNPLYMLSTNYKMRHLFFPTVWFLQEPSHRVSQHQSLLCSPSSRPFKPFLMSVIISQWQLCSSKMTIRRWIFFSVKWIKFCFISAHMLLLLCKYLIQQDIFMILWTTLCWSTLSFHMATWILTREN